jgi:hypothetical protein
MKPLAIVLLFFGMLLVYGLLVLYALQCAGIW